MEKTNLFIAVLSPVGKKYALKLRAAITKPYAMRTDKNSLRAQLTIAQMMGARYIAIIGMREAIDRTVRLRDTKTGDDQEMARELFIDFANGL